MRFDRRQEDEELSRAMHDYALMRKLFILNKYELLRVRLRIEDLRPYHHAALNAVPLAKARAQRDQLKREARSIAAALRRFRVNSRRT